MQYVYPSYYPSFACIKGACRHSCCIGWEIDVDGDALARYDAETGDVGERLRAAIERDGTPHFILTKDERCPFLNREGLCDLILARGEGALCDICREHPRFHNELPGRLESGLGLSCEAAAELILGTEERVTLVGLDGTPNDDEILRLRDEAIEALQERDRPIDLRLSALLSRYGASVPTYDCAAWTELLLSLECLDPAWTDLIRRLKERGDALDFSAFDAHVKEHETEYEQLLVYLVYRYTANAFDEAEAVETLRFAAFSYRLLHALGALLFTEQGRSDFTDRVELVRLFSSEIEYCEENVERITDFLRI